ncbi:MAG: carboxyltransferase domain-containing protein [Pseudomonadota bacterium]
MINADRWKIGQLVAGDQVQFSVVTEGTAHDLLTEQQQYVTTLIPPNSKLDADQRIQYSPIIHGPGSPVQEDDIVIRMSGQEWILVEFGHPELDIEQHLRMHGLKQQIEASGLQGIIEMTPGIRSLQIRFDIQHWRFESLKNEINRLLSTSGDNHKPIASRIVHLPLSWDDPACQEAVQIYTHSVRDNAPWCPDNIEFIRRINGLDTREDVKRTVFDASYLVMGLGDVYLGAPVATPLDPRHRLVTTKYNPARTWTAENSVGIGGSYLCIYGMEGPGGYQFVGRTLQVWNHNKRGDAFSEYWLLRPFDQLRFYEVGAEELLAMREDFSRGALSIEIEDTVFDPQTYRRFLEDNAESIARFKDQRSTAFATELDDWKQKGLLTFETQVDTPVTTTTELPEGAIPSPMSGSVWSVRVEPGADVEEDEVLVVLEAMKSEFEIKAPATGTVELLVEEGQLVNSGQALAVIS